MKKKRRMFTNYSPKKLDHKIYLLIFVFLHTMPYTRAGLAQESGMWMAVQSGDVTAVEQLCRYVA